MFQANCLGRNAVPLPNICNELLSPCLCELMPLPSPRINGEEWPYAGIAEQFPGLRFLNNREDYTENIMPIRLELLGQRIQESHQLKIVCFYGMDYLDKWEKVAKVPLHRAQLRDNLGTYYLGNRNGTCFIVSLHPAAIGLRNDYFTALGEVMQDLL